jgi:hypothetical protein
MSLKINNIISDTLLTIDTNTQINDQSTFFLAPHCAVVPSTAEDLCK